MVFRSVSRHLPLAIAALLVVLLAALAILQWRWIGEVSEVETQRMRASLMSAGSRFTEDFDREITRTFLYFHPELSDQPEGRRERVAGQYARWAAEAPYPGLVRDVFYVGHGDDFECLRPEKGRFEACPWPADLEVLRRHLLLAEHRRRHGASLSRLPTPMPAVPELPGLVIPLPLLQQRTRAGVEVEPVHLIVRMDPQVMVHEVFPALTQRHFKTAEGQEYALAVVDGKNPGAPIFRSDPEVPASAFRSADVRLDMFFLRSFAEMRSLWTGRHGGARQRSGGHTFSRIWAPPPEDRLHGEGRGWQLLVRHREGSLEKAVAAVRRRNLGVSLGILALLAATSGLMVVATQRAQRLARQQIEFVAGVTHELNTPLTAIRSAGQNLADGVVAEPAQVRRYGNLIANEGRRLSNMVGQALEFAGILSGRRAYHPRPVAVEEVVAGALEDTRWLLEDRGIEVEMEVAPSLPAVLADPAVLRRAVQNLIENAVKHGGPERWLAVRARQAATGEVEITVSDRGPGIRREDLPHLFEPFYRGREAEAGNVPGSGLGLSLVRHIAEAHRGRVTVSAGEGGRGSAFTLQLPAAPEAADFQAVEEPA